MRDLQATARGIARSRKAAAAREEASAALMQPEQRIWRSCAHALLLLLALLLIGLTIVVGALLLPG